MLRTHTLWPLQARAWCVFAALALAVGGCEKQPLPAKAGHGQQRNDEDPAEKVHEVRAVDSQLFAAVGQSDARAVAACIAKGANVNARNDMGCTPLEVAADGGRFAAAQALIAHGADVNAREDNGMTALHWAVLGQAYEVCEVLIANGADVNARLVSGWTPLHDAAQEGDVRLVTLLIRSGADLALRNEDEATPLRVAVDYAEDRGNTEIVDLLLQSGAVPDIFTAAALGQVDRVRKLLEEDPALARAHDTPGAWESTALHKAAYHGRSEVVELLLAHGADANAKDSWGAAPLHEAVYGKHQEVVRMLLDHGADVNAVVGTAVVQSGRVRHSLDDTPLHLAARNGDVAMVKMLLERGADVKARNSDGVWLFGIRPRPGSGPTALGVAIKGGKKEVADLLRQHGASQ